MRYCLILLLITICSCAALDSASALELWNNTAELTASDGAGGDWFGYSVAIQGQTALIGAPRDDISTNLNQGSAYIFTESGGVWSQHQKLTASGGAADDRFGTSCALDGNFAAIGTYEADYGSVYIFRNQSGTWTQTQVLNEGSYRYALNQIALDGTRMAVSTWAEEVYVYDYNGTTWSQTARITGSGRFGRAVDIDGDRMVIGAYADVEGGLSAGAAYVYEYDGTTWTQVAKLLGDENSAMGEAVSLDGDVVALGGRQANALAYAAGEVNIFKRDSLGNWSNVAELYGSDTDSGDYFGESISLKDDTLFVGAYAAGPGGQMYAFKEVAGTWTETEIICPSDIVINNAFTQGASGIDYDGSTVIAGSLYNGSDGSAYTFEYASFYPGDANKDKVVDQDDAAILAEHWLMQSGATWDDGDFNGDEKVDDADATLMAVNWLKTSPTSGAAVPEPSCLVLLLAAGLAIFAGRWHKLS